MSMSQARRVAAWDMMFFAYYFAEMMWFAVTFPVEVVVTVFKRLLNSDSLPLEIQGGLMAVLLGHGFYYWRWAIFSSAYKRGVDVLDDVMPLPAWGLVLIAIGVIRLFVIFLEMRRCRLAMAIVTLFYWAFWAGCLFVDDPPSLLAKVAIALACSSAFSFWMLMRGGGHAK